MHPVLFSFHNTTIFTYGFFVAMGFLLATFFAYWQVGGFRSIDSRQGISSFISADQLLSLVIWIVISGIIGARIFYVIQFWSQFASDPPLVFNIRGGGLVFYGGLIGGLVALYWFCKIHRLPLLKVLDLVTPAVILGYSIGRIGCFLEGCCSGKVTHLPWAVHFPLLEGLRHPTQLYSSFLALLIFFFLIRLAKRQSYTGQVFFWGIVLQSCYRFGIEFLRENPLYYGLSSAQWIALGLVIIHVEFFILRTKAWRWNGRKFMGKVQSREDK